MLSLYHATGWALRYSSELRCPGITSKWCKDVLWFEDARMSSEPHRTTCCCVLWYSNQHCWSLISWLSVKLAACSLLLSFDITFFFYCLIVSHQDWKAVTAPSLWNDLLFKQPSNGISDREIRLQCLGFSEIKSLIDGRKDEKGFSPWFCQWLWLYGNLNRATFELRQSRQLVAFVLYVHVYRF